MIDFHSHILPQIDDGSHSLEESIAMLRAEAAQGITHVVATPHFYAKHDSPQRFLERRYEAEQRLREEMANHEGLPKLIVGAEVHFFQGISESEALMELTITGKRCILIEMKHTFWTEHMYQELKAIREQRNVIPVIAHVDRYISPLRTHHIPERLAELPVAVQANASFFVQPSTRRMALRMLAKEQIHLLGSDCHNLTDRKPNLGRAVGQIEANLGQTALEQIKAFGHTLLGEYF